MSDPALIIQGNLLTRVFLTDGIRQTPEWLAISDADADALLADLHLLFAKLPAKGVNESQTEDDLIWPVISRLGWIDSLRQQNLAVKGRDDVPDGILFPSSEAKARANASAEQYRRYEHAAVLVESKRSGRPLDRSTGGRSNPDEATAPSTQMLRYLRRADDITGGKLRWGILTNGARWRLYFSGARSVSEDFFEIDLAAIAGAPAAQAGLFSLGEADRRHWVRVFALIFSRSSFIAQAGAGTTFLQRALAQGRFYEESVAGSLAKLVFDEVFPKLALSIAAAAPEAPLDKVRDAALVLLYRLLFILYAEDRDLLPVRDPRYKNYSLRDNVRSDVGRRKDADDTFSATAARYWNVIADLCRAIDSGDGSIGLPPYNGGLFDEAETPLLSEIRLGDEVIADVIDALSFERTETGRKYINYRDLSVRQLGSIYERLLEHEIRREDGILQIRPNAFARKGSGSYYTPDDLVGLIIRETLAPLIAEKMDAFRARTAELAAGRDGPEARRALMTGADPATAMLELRICDPAMGSGHFLVALVDYLTDQVIAALADAEKIGEDVDYYSPLDVRIADIRQRIFKNATDNNWVIDLDQLDDRHIIRRMVLKRCVFGVDKNPMAVVLAKVSLWLHSFTVGAPLSFLDHHLRCGDSLFGSWVRGGIDRAKAVGAPLLLHGPITEAMRAARQMKTIEGLTDAEIAEANLSESIFEEVREKIAPLDALLKLVHAFDWLNLRTGEDRVALQAFFTGVYGDPTRIASGELTPVTPKERGGADPLKKQKPQSERADYFKDILARAMRLVNEEYFLNWQVAFPGVWSQWDSAERHGGFDAVIGNPPWDRMKLQEVEWFATRRPAIALQGRASDRKAMVDALKESDDPLSQDYKVAEGRAMQATSVARGEFSKWFASARQQNDTLEGDYPLLSGGDVNIYSLFVERAMALVKPTGMVGLLTPSGIASDKTAAKFFRSIATTGRLNALYDFENRRTRFDTEPFFPDVDSRFKFNAFVASPTRNFAAARCAFFLQDVSELSDPERCFPLAAADFARVNPNTGTAPIFRTRRDAVLTAAIYTRLPVLVDRSDGGEVKAWPVRYATMFHMTNDSGLFRTRRELEEQEGAWPTGGNRWRSAAGDWLPLYEGKMVQAFDHRAASVVVNEANLNRPAQPLPATDKQHADPAWLPNPQYWVSEISCEWPKEISWTLGFKDITSPTNERTFIASLFPSVGFGNKVPLLKIDAQVAHLELLAANFNSTIFDFATRQKIQGQTLNWFIVEQLPVVPPAAYNATRFGAKSAAEIVRESVLELTYVAHDMASFARDMGYVDASREVKSPFVWDDARRLNLRAKLDALYFILYGVTDRDDVRYIYSTFPIVEREETKTWGDYASRELCLQWMNALSAGKPDADIAWRPRN